MQIETDHLILKPLTYQQLLKYLLPDFSLEEELGVESNPRKVSEELADALRSTIIPNTDKSHNYLFCTLWTVISKDENTMIGDLSFYGEPNENGEVEFGYGTYTKYRGRGYMTQAVAALIKWALSQNEVKSVIASTDKNNIASIRILEKNDFIKTGENGDLYNWCKMSY